MYPPQKSQAELAFLSTLDSVSLQRSLQQVLTTNMVNMLPLSRGASFRSTYDLSELAREYLAPNTSCSAKRCTRVEGEKTRE